MKIFRNPKNIALFLIFVVSLIFVKLASQIHFIQDDAFTSFRYVDNLLNGKGLVFNTGEYVEGFTNFLWVVILAVVRILGFDIVTAAQVLSILFGILVLLLTYFISEQFYEISENKLISEIFNLVPVFILLLTGGLVYWAVSGMETTMFVCTILASVLYYIRYTKKSKWPYTYVIFLVLATLTRPEGLLFASIIFAHRSFIRTQKSKKAIPNFFFQIFDLRFLLELAVFIIPIGLYYISRFAYYGYLFPNTYYAKTGFDTFYLVRGFNYVLESIRQYMLFGLMLVFPAFASFVKTFRKKYLFLILFVIIYLAALILIGGDVLPLHRFILYILPLIYILFSKSIQFVFTDILRIKNLKMTQIIVLMFVLLASAYMIKNYKTELPKIQKIRSYESGLVNKMKIYGEWYKQKYEFQEQKPVVCLSTIGAFSYYSSANVIDLIGLTDEYIAHNPKEVDGIAENISVLWKERKYNVEYVLERKPEYIIFPAGIKPSAFPEAALFSKPEFIANYYPQLIYSQNMQQYLPVYTRRDSTNWIDADSISDSCDVRAVENFIVANNYFVKYLDNRNESFADSVIINCTKTINYCPLYSSLAYSTMGYVYYQDKNYNEAEKVFLEAYKLDNQNSIAVLYLMKIYNEIGNKSKSYFYMSRLKQLSPDALPNLD